MGVRPVFNKHVQYSIVYWMWFVNVIYRAMFVIQQHGGSEGGYSVHVHCLSIKCLPQLVLPVVVCYVIGLRFGTAVPNACWSLSIRRVSLFM